MRLDNQARSSVPEQTANTQSAATVMMIRPAAFNANPLTAETNAFQKSDAPDASQLLAAAQREFDGLAAKLAAAGVEVCVFQDDSDAVRPDAVFPNNWITTHADGSVVLYPMLAENRRTERRPDLVHRLATEHGFVVRTIVDFSPYELTGKILEGTGSMILDRVNSVVYACRSQRTDADVLAEFCDRFDCRPVLFDAVDRNGLAIYHTNVMMTLGTAFAVVCLESICDPGERDTLVVSLEQTGHELIEITYTQMEQFAGNMLELRAAETLVIAMSQRARDSLAPDQVAALERHANLVSSPIEMLEDYGGGSVRCMLAEIFLPKENMQ
ncbi:MAG: amidinotransferase [Gammaproteobacteria bacterium]|nr:amidinotransferase [Gammaproteobacteria bacterium]NNF62387.1 amidinotransferase [Gammaproteobacteria bacterium]